MTDKTWNGNLKNVTFHKSNFHNLKWHYLEWHKLDQTYSFTVPFYFNSVLNNAKNLKFFNEKLLDKKFLVENNFI